MGEDKITSTQKKARRRFAKRLGGGGHARGD